jgi:hypothetical protein
MTTPPVEGRRTALMRKIGETLVKPWKCGKPFKTNNFESKKLKSE